MNDNRSHGYGTPEYYAELFADFVIDAQCSEPHYGDNLIAGLKLALADLRKYYQDQVKECSRLENLIDDQI
jgi:hypothetical protein